MMTATPACGFTTAQCAGTSGVAADPEAVGALGAIALARVGVGFEAAGVRWPRGAGAGAGLLVRVADGGLLEAAPVTCAIPCSQ